MQLHGMQWIAGSPSGAGTELLQATNPATGDELDPGFRLATPEEIARAASSAAEAFDAFRHVPDGERARFLETVANEIEALGPALLDRCSLETGLPEARLAGERGRTTGQLRMFADLIRGTAWRDIRTDEAIPDRQPISRPDLRRMKLPIGPVAVFGASNFPLAFSVAGGDTASALAAGCPVVVKAHPAHPGTSELTAGAIVRAAEATGMPAGAFSMLHADIEGARRLAGHPALRAIAFTGSRAAGRSLFDLAAGRPEPIPVFAEMGSVNPVFLLPGAARSRAEAFSDGYVQSLTLGVGQFCTNPGVVFLPAGLGLAEGIAARLGAVPAGSMLTSAIGRTYCEGSRAMKGLAGVEPLLDPEAPGQPGLFRCSAAAFLADRKLQSEVFGPFALAVEYGSLDELYAAARSLEGQLTATIHTGDGDEAAALASILETRVGRVVFNGFPTGVEVCAAMQHGGPYPATTDSRYTSVGTAAIERFLRPVCYQNAPADSLPAPLRG